MKKFEKTSNLKKELFSWSSHKLITRLTHTHLISDLFPLSYHFCKTNISISVDYLFTCPALSSCRDSHLVPHDRKLALKNNDEAISRTRSYLDHIGIPHLISLPFPSR